MRCSRVGLIIAKRGEVGAQTVESVRGKGDDTTLSEQLDASLDLLLERRRKRR